MLPIFFLCMALFNVFPLSSSEKIESSSAMTSGVRQCCWNTANKMLWIFSWISTRLAAQDNYIRGAQCQTGVSSRSCPINWNYYMFQGLNVCVNRFFLKNKYNFKTLYFHIVILQHWWGDIYINNIPQNKTQKTKNGLNFAHLIYN